LTRPAAVRRMTALAQDILPPAQDYLDFNETQI
jgi:hypothetical protein